METSILSDRGEASVSLAVPSNQHGNGTMAENHQLA